MNFVLFFSDGNQLCARVIPFIPVRFAKPSTPHRDEETSSTISESTESSIFSSPEQTETINHDKSPDFKRRRNFCPFCEKLITNFSRHLLQHHSDKEEIKEYMALSDESPKKRKLNRALITNKIRNMGNNIHNTQIVEGTRGGSFLPVKRSSHRKYSVDNLTHVKCKHCLGLFKKQSLYKHIQNCKQYQRDESSMKTNKKSIMLPTHSSYLVKTNNSASDLLKRDVFPKMQQDAETLFAQGDSTITKYGSNLRFTHRTGRQIYYCSSKMRTLARLFFTMKKALPEIQEFLDCLDPKHFNTLVDSVRQMSSFDVTNGKTMVPSVSPRLCSSLKSCANIIKSEAIKDKSLTDEAKSEIINRSDKFLFLMDKDWATEVGSISEKSRKQMRVVKKDLLPDPDDIRKFSEYLNKMCPHYISRLNEIPTKGNYESLAKLIIAHIITLNRRRPNETVEITLDAYQTTLNKGLSYGYDLQSVLSEEQINAGKQLSIFYISANKNMKKVPTLLTKKFHKAVDALIAAREKIGITSKYLFGRLGDPELFSGSVVLREIVKKAYLKKPLLFTANSLRHHAATSSQLHSRNDTYTKRLSQFMGHDLKTHEQYYEMPLPLVQQFLVGPRLLEMTLPSTSATVTYGALTSLDVESENWDVDDPISEISSLSNATQTEDLNSSSAAGPSHTVTSGASLVSDVTSEYQNCGTLSSVHTATESGSLLALQITSKDFNVDPSTSEITRLSNTEPNRNANSSPAPSLKSSETLPSTTQNNLISPSNLQTGDRSGSEPNQSAETDNGQTPGFSPQRTPPKIKHKKVRWSMAEKSVVYEKFGHHFISDTKPTRKEIKLVWEKEETLKNRSLQQVVTFINNIVTKKQKVPTPIKKKIERMVLAKKSKLK